MMPAANRRSTAPAAYWAGRYELMQRLATGGMGEVFVARQTGKGAFEKRVALKLLLPHLSDNPRLVSLFLDEARIAARLSHPNIVPIFDLGEADDGRYFIAMGLVEGVSLAELLRACRRAKQQIPLPIVRLIAAGICDALDYAHSLKGPQGSARAIIHRDVTPSNVLISSSGAVQITDFGIAKAQGDTSWNRSGRSQGKLAYMAPEQMESEGANPQVDIYAAAVTLFETLTLEAPFRKQTETQTREAVLTRPLPDASVLRPEIPAAISEALRRGCEKEPAKRLTSIRGLRAAFVEGPSAAAHELGELVQNLCRETLVERERVPELATQGLGTHSILGSSEQVAPPQPQASPAPGPGLRLRLRWPLAAALALIPVAVWGALQLRPKYPEPLKEVPVETPPALARAPLEPDVATTAAPLAPLKVSKSPALVRRKRRDAPAARTGFLTVDSTPWSEVFENGVLLDRTPFARFPLAAGEHVLVFRNREQKLERRRRVRIEPGRETFLKVGLQ